MPPKKTVKPDATPPPAAGNSVAHPPSGGKPAARPPGATGGLPASASPSHGKPSPLVDTRVLKRTGSFLTNRGTMRESRRLVRAEKP